MGHSVGEYVAACVAGVFSLENGLKLIAARGRLIQALPREGEMAAIFVGEERVAAAVAPYAEEVFISAVNGPENVVITGVRKSVRKILNELSSEGIRAVQLKVSHAFHSPLMEPMLAPFEEIAAKVEYRAPGIELISNVTGQLVKNNEVCKASYWRQHLREPVRFASGMKTLHEKGYELFLEIGPSPTLLAMGRRCFPEGAAVWLPSLRKGRGDWKQILESLGELYVRGVDIDWSGFYQNYPYRRISLPTYPFERKRYWIEKTHEDKSKTMPTHEPDLNRVVHPLLGQRLPAAIPIFESCLNLNSLSYFKEHRFYGNIMASGAVFFEMAIAAGREVFGPNSYIEEVTIFEPLIFEKEDGLKNVQVILIPEDSGTASFKIFSLIKIEKEQNTTWKLHVSGKINGVQKYEDTSAKELFTLEDIKVRCQDKVSIEKFYSTFQKRGLQYGVAFRGVKNIWRRDGEALGELQIADSLLSETENYRIHPALLDSCLQVMSAAVPTEKDQSISEVAAMPVGLDRIRFYGDIPVRLWCHAMLHLNKESNMETFVGNFRLFELTGKVVAEIVGLHMKRARHQTFRRMVQDKLEDNLYEVQWRPKDGLSLAESAAFLHQLKKAPMNQRQELLKYYLKQKIAQELHLDIEQIAEDGDLIQMGMDSLIFLNLAQVLGKELQIKIVPHEIFDMLKISEMAKRFANDILSELAPNQNSDLEEGLI
jgi:acyl transferase domain-containing protein